jgi:hypothetical protein
MRSPLHQLKLAAGQQARISEVITDWYGPGGRHNLYVGLIKGGACGNANPTVFAFDPWQHDRAKQFKILSPNPRNGNITLGSALIRYDPVAEILYYEKAPRGIPETRIDDGSEIDATGSPIDLYGKGAKSLKNLSLAQSVCADAPSARRYLDAERFERMSKKNCGQQNLAQSSCRQQPDPIFPYLNIQDWISQSWRLPNGK